MLRNIDLHIISLRGKRMSNEDVENYNMNLSANGAHRNPNFAPADFFVICDGHGGKEVAEFVVPELEKYLMRKNLIYPLPHTYISKVYNLVQQKLIKHPNKIAKQCGTTALIVVRYIGPNQQENIQVI